MTALLLNEVSLSYGGHQVLSSINLSVREGEFVSIVGPSGCGKTTLLRLIAGLVQPSSGSVAHNGAPVSKPSRERAVVFQDYGKALLPWRKVWNNIARPLEDTGMGQEAVRRRSMELLSAMKLEQFAEHFPEQLSGGMQQRVQIARSLAQEPKVWLMDEPFGALDAITRQQLQDEILRIAAERAITVIFITHDLEEAIYLGDRVIVLGAHPGRVVEEIAVDIPKPRDQLTTREHTAFLQARHRLFGLLQGH